MYTYSVLRPAAKWWGQTFSCWKIGLEVSHKSLCWLVVNCSWFITKKLPAPLTSLCQWVRLGLLRARGLTKPRIPNASEPYGRLTLTEIDPNRFLDHSLTNMIGFLNAPRLQCSLSPSSSSSQRPHFSPPPPPILTHASPLRLPLRAPYETGLALGKLWSERLLLRPRSVCVYLHLGSGAAARLAAARCRPCEEAAKDAIFSLHRLHCHLKSVMSLAAVAEKENRKEREPLNLSFCISLTGSLCLQVWVSYFRVLNTHICKTAETV